MLDELDALMERMLSLPVADLDTQLPAPPQSLLTLEEPSAPAALTLPPETGSDVESTTVPPPPVRAEVESAPLPLQGPHIRPVPAGKIIVGRLSAPPFYSPPPEQESAEKNRQANDAGDEQPLGAPAQPPAGDAALPSLIIKPSVERPARAPVRRRSVFRVGFQWLLGLNQAFDRATLWLGGTGQRLRSTRGRLVLGLVGLALFALAVTWCLHDWLGWNWFKLSLE